ncbi:farnesyl pyrophosphate synthase isoform X1 [Tribolium castaneum]|uniref:farnesyl pyrophosphate synthase isoform X1 n=1 Tax=Tribolium castaneum TaxID=7070 RepID=UPI00077DBB84|nr:PREDICTED: farnesyl pyrophosphate synthase isoform X1 [Tribolium castaneum]|eukprot:XP_015836774.1 PREDICTED: farnesyl pyrophosphate synthase isoform X1 [Tribolium castaneum]
MALSKTIASRLLRQFSKTLSVKNRNISWRIHDDDLTCRALSTIQTKAKPQTSNYTLVSKDESREFMAVFPDIVRDLTDAGRQTDIPEVTKRYAKALHYNVPNGKKNRGLAVIAAYKMLEKEENLTPENIRLANIMGWCVELLQGFFLVTDDIIDRSEMRRGMPCWYKKDDTGLNAFNDAILLEHGIYTLLKRHFSQHHCYVPTMELFHDVTLKTSMGQALDCLCNKDGKPNLELFTMNKYNSIVKYKTAYYTFQLPVALAMYMANLYDPEMHRQAKTILMEMGLFFQIQDDFLDCFGDPEVTGKKGNDIREGKCSWLAVVALQRANPTQRKIMEEYYGRPDPEAVRIIRNLYEELSLPNTYAIYEEESFNIIRTHIQQISKGLPHKLFFKIMEKIYRRDC